MFVKKKYILLFLMLFPLVGISQILIHPDSVEILGSVVVDGDTIPNKQVKEVRVFPKIEFKNNRHRRRYTRLMRNVKKAHPFSVIVRNEFAKMNDSLHYIVGERERKKFIKDYEKEMFRRYEDDLRKLTFSQGRILLKLVYRELGNTSYHYVKEYRGDFSAVFWQGIARLFGANLKSTYDPAGEDAEIELIVQMIEAGVI